MKRTICCTTNPTPKLYFIINTNTIHVGNKNKLNDYILTPSPLAFCILDITKCLDSFTNFIVQYPLLHYTSFHYAIFFYISSKSILHIFHIKLFGHFPYKLSLLNNYCSDTKLMSGLMLLLYFFLYAIISNNLMGLYEFR